MCYVFRKHPAEISSGLRYSTLCVAMAIVASTQEGERLEKSMSSVNGTEAF